MSFYQQQGYNQYPSSASPAVSLNSYQQQQQPSNGSNGSNGSQLWMGELDPFWDENSIKSIWLSLGFNNINVKLIKEKIQQGFNNAGYCFIEFPNIEQASNALNSNGLKIPNTNKSLKLNWASGGQNSNNHNNNNNNNGSIGYNRNEVSIFVGDLAPDVSDTILYEYFGSKYPSVSGTKIMIDSLTGGSKGYGFVRFINELEQKRALVEMQGAILNGRPIRVSTAVPKNRQQQQGQQQGGGFNGNQGFNGSRFNNNLQPLQSSIPSSSGPSQQILNGLESQYQPPLTQFTDPNNTTVFIGGLSSIVTEDELRLYFQPFGDITYVKIPVGKGCGFVQYVTRSSAELAISKMQGYPIGNSRIRLSWGRSNSNPKPQGYKQQPELPLLYGYNPSPQFPNQFNQTVQPQGFQQVPQQVQQQQQQQLQQQVQQPTFGNFGINQIQNSNQFNQDQSEPISSADQSRLNELYLAAKDGRLDTIDSNANGYIFA
ncbi:Nucleolysin TIA-1 isoform [Wickerhamomyces ciferrii]|uniref:Nucleolysin TIA-1 isoform n=1 Tax=Wickerhamomyces ciferrii (strain ATCC 14091 / BCRC 22168 / CBS 111 / JCM 3599 / NBRC 0793 / NRRL Y-1031 F-60-10) TaxID=1206466 RepID=K0KXK9_WICCF|nr:Nucleolysin TIA-1 isoform [Wickerhamomyces ciferrii]CCH45778.1 Nucleolysin TIA-1 isoform [Wickerhamomyces ciferrii]